jgi:hypothetical protein
MRSISHLYADEDKKLISVLIARHARHFPQHNANSVNNELDPSYSFHSDVGCTSILPADTINPLIQPGINTITQLT